MQTLGTTPRRKLLLFSSGEGHRGTYFRGHIKQGLGAMGTLEQNVTLPFSVAPS